MPRALSATQGGRGGGQAWPLPWQCAFRPVFRSAFRFAFWPASAARVCRGFRSRGGGALLRPLFALFYRFAPRLLVGMRGRLAGWLRESCVPNLPIKSANRPQRPWMLRSVLSIQEKSVDKCRVEWLFEGRMWVGCGALRWRGKQAAALRGASAEKRAGGFCRASWHRFAALALRRAFFVRIWIQDFAYPISKHPISPVNTAKGAMNFQAICG